FGLVCACGRRRGAASADKRRSRLGATLVSGREIVTFLASYGEGWQTGASSVVDLADGRRRFILVHRSPERREQSGLGAGWENDCVHERHKRGGPGQTRKEKAQGRRIEKGRERKFAIRHGCHKKSRESDGDTEGRTRRGCEKSGGRSGTRERHSRDHAGGLPGR